MKKIMAIEEPVMKPPPGNTSWANFQDNVGVGWSSDFSSSFQHQSTGWPAQDTGGSEWKEFSHTKGGSHAQTEAQTENEWQDLSHTDSLTEWQDFSNVSSIPNGRDSDFTDSAAEWQPFNHTATRTENSTFLNSTNDTSKSSETFHQCFPPTFTCKDRQSLAFQSLSSCRQWSELADTSLSLVNTSPVFEQTLNKLLIHSDTDVSCNTSLQLDLPADDNPFEWNTSGTSSPPLVSPSYFRPEKPESPVDIHFDHGRAALGLASLSEEELQEMLSEMESKFGRLSEVLITELQQRDLMASQLDIKNGFIAALLRVQTLKHLSSITTSDNTMKGLRSRSRTWSLSSSGKAAKPPEEKSSGKFLDSVVPYHLPEDGQWRVSMLQQLTKILRAIADNSDAVPSLVATYIQSEIIDSVKETPEAENELADRTK